MLRALAILLLSATTASALTVPMGLLSWNPATGQTTVTPVDGTSLTDVATSSNFQSWTYEHLTSWTSGATTYQACCYWDENSKLVIGKRVVLPTRTAWTLYIYDGTGGRPNITRTGSDNHDGPAIAIDADGIIHAGYDQHGDSIHYRRATASIASWTGGLGAEETWTGGGANENQVTYPMYVVDPVDKLRVFYRDGSSGNGNLLYHSFNNTTDAWVGGAMIIDGGNNTPAQSPYWAPPVFSSDWNGAGTGFMYLFWGWRQFGSANSSDNHDLCCVRWNGTIWEAMDGTDLTLPITLANDPVIDPIAIGDNLASFNAAAVDPAGRPHVVYGATDGSDNFQIYHSWHNGTTWVKLAMTDTYNRITNLHSGVDIDIESDGTAHIFVSCTTPKGDGLWRYSSNGSDYTTWTKHVIRDEHIGYVNASITGISIRNDKVLWREHGIYQALVPIQGSVEEDAGLADYSRWRGYATHSLVTNPSTDLEYTTLWVSMNQLPAGFWNEVGAGGFDIRAAKDPQGTQPNWLPVDVIHFSDAGSSGTGLMAIGWWGTRASSGSQRVYIFAGNSAAATLAAGDSYGRYNAYPTQVRVCDPDGGGNNRAAPFGTSESNIVFSSFGGVTGGAIAGPVNSSKSTDYSGSQYFTAANSGATGGFSITQPLGFMAMSNPDNNTAGHTLCGTAQATSTANYQILHLAGNVAGDFANFQTRGATPATAESAVAFTPSVWQHVGGYALTATSRAVLLNGANKGTNINSMTPTTLTALGIGGLDRTADLFSDGKLAFVTFWQGNMTDAQISYEKEMLDDADQSDFYGAWSWEQPLAAEVVAFNSCWTWYNDPRAAYAGGKLYFGGINNHGVIGVYSWDFDRRMLLFGTPRPDLLQIDDHDNPAICPLANGKILIAYSVHNGDSYSSRTVNANDLRSWTTPVQLASGAQNDAYAHLIELADDNDTEFWFFRQGDASTRPTAYRTSINDGDSWSASQDLITVSAQRPYFKAVKNGNLRIDFCVTTGDPNEATNCSLYHGYILINQAGTTITYHKSDGTEVFSPTFSPGEFTLVYDGTSPALEAWNWEIRIISGVPVILFATFESGDTIHHYHQARWTGSAWQTDEVTTGGTTATEDWLALSSTTYSGGIGQDPNNLNFVYLSREYGAGNFRLEKWQHTGTFPSGSWAKIEDTSGNTGTINARPFCVDVAGQTHVLWWEGTYPDFTSYATNVRMTPAPDWRREKPGSPIWTSAYAPTGARAYYLLNEGGGTAVNDLTPNNYDGAFTGAPAWNAGDVTDFGPYLTGFTVSDYVNLDTAALAIEETEYPLWIYALFRSTSTGTATQCPVGFGHSTDADPLFWLFTNVTTATTVGGQWRDLASVGASLSAVKANSNDGQYHVMQIWKGAANNTRCRFDTTTVANASTTTGTVVFQRGAIGVLRRNTIANPYLGEVHAVVVGWGAEPDFSWQAMDLIRGQFAGTFDPDVSDSGVPIKANYYRRLRTAQRKTENAHYQLAP